MPKREPIKVVLYGVGAVGSMVAAALLERKGVEVVGAIDVDPAKAGKDLGELAGFGRSVSVAVSDDASAVLSEAEPDVVVHATSSFLREVFPQVAECVEHGANVISTCEELSHPYATDPELATRLDELAKEHGVTVLGAGINPGFLMDLLPTVLTAPCVEVRSVRVVRIIDVAKRRKPFRRKVGVGLSVEEFEEKIRGGELTGHVGLVQSAELIADALGWELDGIEVNSAKPIVAEEPIGSGGVTVERGRVIGLEQAVRGVRGGEVVITLEFRAYVGAEEFDEILVDGVPPVRARIEPCVHGDLGTVGVVVNYLPRVITAPPGLLTVIDMPAPSAALGDLRAHL